MSVRPTTIPLKLTPWEVMVLRAALENHLKGCNEKHREAALSILKKSREHDNPLGSLKTARKP